MKTMELQIAQILREYRKEINAQAASHVFQDKLDERPQVNEQFAILCMRYMPAELILKETGMLPSKQMSEHQTSQLTALEKLAAMYAGKRTFVGRSIRNDIDLRQVTSILDSYRDRIAYQAWKRQARHDTRLHHNIMQSIREHANVTVPQGKSDDIVRNVIDRMEWDKISAKTVQDAVRQLLSEPDACKQLSITTKGE